MKNDDVRIVLSFEDLWKEIYGDDSHLPNAGFGGRTDFIKSNPELIERFEAEYEKALEWVLENPKEAGLLTEKEFGMNAEIVEAALPKMGLTYMSAQDAKPYLEKFYELLYSYNPTSIGGKIADSGMLYDKEI
jgi:NitT/TauT family transport system substrate-binding protein